MPPKSAKIKISSTSKPTKPPPPPKPNVPAPISLSKIKSKSKPTKKHSPEIPNEPLPKLGTEERKLADAKRNEAASINVLGRLQTFMAEIIKNTPSNNLVRKKPNFQLCQSIMSSSTPIADLSADPIRRLVISEFIDINSPAGLSAKNQKSNAKTGSEMLDTHDPTLALQETIQDHINQCRFHLESRDSDSVGVGLQLLGILSQDLSGEAQLQALTIIDDLKEKHALLLHGELASHDAKHSSEFDRALSDTNNDTDSDTGSVLSGDASDDDLSEVGDEFEPEL